jgi:hypothetical protein
MLESDCRTSEAAERRTGVDMNEAPPSPPGNVVDVRKEPVS